MWLLLFVVTRHDCSLGSSVFGSDLARKKEGLRLMTYVLLYIYMTRCICRETGTKGQIKTLTEMATENLPNLTLRDIEMR